MEARSAAPRWRMLAPRTATRARAAPTAPLERRGCSWMRGPSLPPPPISPVPCAAAPPRPAPTPTRAAAAAAAAYGPSCTLAATRRLQRAAAMMTATRALATQRAAPHPPLHQLQLRAAVSPRRRLEYSSVAQDEVAAGAADPLARPAAPPLQLVVARGTLQPASSTPLRSSFCATSPSASAPRGAPSSCPCWRCGGCGCGGTSLWGPRLRTSCPDSELPPDWDRDSGLGGGGRRARGEGPVVRAYLVSVGARPGFGAKTGAPLLLPEDFFSLSLQVPSPAGSRPERCKLSKGGAGGGEGGGLQPRVTG